MRLFYRKTASAGAGDTGGDDIRVRVDGGYDPDRVFVPAGEPVTLILHRHDASPCSEGVVFPDQGVRAQLPRHEDIALDLPPSEPGEYEFHCGMGMLRGRMVVR